MALLSRTALRSDPVLNNNFVVSLLDTSSVLATLGAAALSALLDVAVGGFSECMGIEMTMKAEEYNEGGNNATVLKFPNRVAWSNITLRKGVGATTALWDWHYEFVEGQGKRRDGVIVLMTNRRIGGAVPVPNNIWFFRRGLPVKYSGPQLNAMQNNVAIEMLEIAHEGIYQVPVVGLGGAVASGSLGSAAGGAVAAGLLG